VLKHKMEKCLMCFRRCESTF